MDPKRLERLVHARQLQRDVRRAELARADADLAQAREALARAAAASAGARRTLGEVGEAGVLELEARAQALAEAREGQDSATRQLAASEEERTARGASLRTADAAVKGLEIARVRLARIALRRRERAEQARADDRTASLWRRS